MSCLPVSLFLRALWHCCSTGNVLKINVVSRNHFDKLLSVLMRPDSRLVRGLERIIKKIYDFFVLADVGFRRMWWEMAKKILHERVPLGKRILFEKNLKIFYKKLDLKKKDRSWHLEIF